MRPLLNILTPNTFGLHADAAVVKSSLARTAWTFAQFPHPGWPPHSLRFRAWRALRPRLWFGPPYTANLFLERLYGDWFSAAHEQLFIPNQEWLRESDHQWLAQVDRVLCKTRHAEAIFKGLGCKAEWIGFSSPDLAILDATRPLRPPLEHYVQPRFLHIAGKSRWKGTRALVALWSRHPEWPPLTAVVHREVIEEQRIPRAAVNIDLVSTPLSAYDVRSKLLAANAVLCPSEAEGWGHSIGEALGAAAVVVTTDAPPMYELVTVERGLLAAAADSQPMGLSTRYRVDDAALESCIERILSMTAAQRMKLGHAARDWFESNRDAFCGRLSRALPAPAS
jgi:hypothetical protein